MAPGEVRPLREEDHEQVLRVFVAARDELIARGGRTPPRTEALPDDLLAVLAGDPGGCWRVSVDGEVKGFAASIVRGPIWFLSGFWVLPSEQGRGLGRPLLERALAYGDARGARARSVWASLDARAQSLYIRAGMEPRWPIYLLEGAAPAAARFVREAGPVVPAAASAGSVAGLEAEVTGQRREAEHERWIARPGSRVFGARGKAGLEAFAYLMGGRYVGPAAGRTPAGLRGAVALALAGAEREVVLRVPGAAFDLLGRLVRAGFRCADPALYMASEVVGRPEVYLPSGPFLF